MTAGRSDSVSVLSDSVASTSAFETEEEEDSRASYGAGQGIESIEESLRSALSATVRISQRRQSQNARKIGKREIRTISVGWAAWEGQPCRSADVHVVAARPGVLVYCSRVMGTEHSRARYVITRPGPPRPSRPPTLPCSPPRARGKRPITGSDRFLASREGETPGPTANRCGCWDCAQAANSTRRESWLRPSGCTVVEEDREEQEEAQASRARKRRCT